MPVIIFRILEKQPDARKLNDQVFLAEKCQANAKGMWWHAGTQLLESYLLFE